MIFNKFAKQDELRKLARSPFTLLKQDELRKLELQASRWLSDFRQELRNI